MNVIDRIQSLLQARGVPRRSVRRELAKTCEISYEAVRQWFSGDTANIRNEHLVSIARKYKVTVDWLLSGDLAELKTGAEAKTGEIDTKPASAQQADPKSKTEAAAALLEAVAALHAIQAGLFSGQLTDSQVEQLMQIRNDIVHSQGKARAKGQRLQGLAQAAFQAEENGGSPDDLLKMYQRGMEKEFAKEGAAAREPGKKPARRT
ncbi:helix-turn-helix domain-containing protein [Pseudomonas xionganensis]|uniref:Helix-turn-helix domain-containing protein n=1 Tax=Pseudomonas xionganensis TaxID=2654845 RepID=A0A6I4KTD6_9PSED|nr:helix-turn-helix transcriptional regulator [Pseudomonas xionganensis]MVW75367.1 helix-turn-helix domain-containing protein [Pseudomonas xionganensis]